MPDTMVRLKDSQLTTRSALHTGRQSAEDNAVCRQFGEEGPFWGRQYFFWHNDKPLTLIYEVFSPSLQRLLGPALQ